MKRKLIIHHKNATEVIGSAHQLVVISILFKSELFYCK